MMSLVYIEPNITECPEQCIDCSASMDTWMNCYCQTLSKSPQRHNPQKCFAIYTDHSQVHLGNWWVSESNQRSNLNHNTYAEFMKHSWRTMMTIDSLHGAFFFQWDEQWFGEIGGWGLVYCGCSHVYRGRLSGSLTSFCMAHCCLHFVIRARHAHVDTCMRATCMFKHNYTHAHTPTHRVEREPNTAKGEARREREREQQR